MDLKLIFHNYKSILSGCNNGDTYSLGQVPKGEPVTVIAIKGSANRLQMAVLNMKILDKEITGLRFVPVTAADIKATIKQFNSLMATTTMK